MDNNEQGVHILRKHVKVLRVEVHLLVRQGATDSWTTVTCRGAAWWRCRATDSFKMFATLLPCLQERKRKL